MQLLPDSVHPREGHDGVAVEHDLPKLVDSPTGIPDRIAEGRGIALPTEHRLTHWPESPSCDVCNRAQLYSRKVPSFRQCDDRIDLPDPDAFGQQLACDHMTIFK